MNWNGIWHDTIANTLLDHGVGLISDFSDNAANNQTMGGNFEVITGKVEEWGRYGTVVFGKRGTDQMDNQIREFIRKQDMQAVYANDLDVTWLQLGHVDEVVSFGTRQAPRMRVASPEAAIALLAMTKDVGNGDKELMSNFALSPTLTINDLLNNVDLIREDNMSLDGYADKIHATIQTGLGLTPAVSDPIKLNGGPSPLRRAGYLEVLDTTPGTKSEWKLKFTSNTMFEILKKSGTDYVAAGSGDRNNDSYSTSKEMYILKEWWTEQTNAGDEICFTTQQSPDMLEMPVIFRRGSDGAIAYTNNVINAVVNETTIIMPKVDEEDDVNGILNKYVASAALSAGFLESFLVSDELYHDGNGSLHCGSNVFREIKDDWWTPF